VQRAEDKLCLPESYIKVSRTESKRARIEKTVQKVKRAKMNLTQRYQAGEDYWREVLNDIYSATRNKKVVLFVDLFLSVGDTALGFFQLLKSCGGMAAKPLLYYLGVDFREHFYTVARIRLIEEAKRDFNGESLFVEGFCPLPQTDPSWSGRVWVLAKFARNVCPRLRLRWSSAIRTSSKLN
jgi:hypothetical protein